MDDPNVAKASSADIQRLMELGRDLRSAEICRVFLQLNSRLRASIGALKSPWTIGGAGRFRIQFQRLGMGYRRADNGKATAA
jgi:hypothetical protein